MRVSVVSDVHGATDALARAGDGADALVCLGDLIHFIDYGDYSGIMADLFGVDAVRKLVELRTARRFDDARDWSRQLWATIEEDRFAVLDRAIRGQYEELFAAFPTPTYLTYGNVDLPHLYADYLRDGVTLLDGEVVEIGGRTFGFVGGGLRTPMRTPTEIDDDVYAAKVAAVGAVDVLCCHIPPHLPELVYDTAAERFERGSEAVLEAIRETQPAYCLFGHVHQPLRASVRIGRTECVNVGHFRGTGRPFVLEW
ncbi:MAG TPA: metallophosphoesterase [Mycobacteriales bacterium]|jgi:Icc-related predicted phosphoesterase|nr:metallophosphoesterase [Mycobacteriales bacterium]